jgi:hypothetical protein
LFFWPLDDTFPLEETVMNKNVKGAIAGAVALILIGGGVYFGVQAAKKGAQCPFCKKYFPHGDIMGHKLKCPKNDTDLTPKPVYKR